MRSGAMRRPKVLSVFWHGVASDALAGDGDSMDPPVSLFKSQVQFLIDRYTPVSVWEFLKIIDGGRPVESYPRPPVLLGFDDGFRSVIVNALPILVQLGVPAVAFVIAAVVKDPNFLPWFVERKQIIRRARHRRIVYRGADLDLNCLKGRAQAQRLVEAAFRAARSDEARQHVMTHFAELVGVRRPVVGELDDDLCLATSDDLARLGESSMLTVGSHAMTHRHLADLNNDEQRRELRDSDTVLRQHIAAYCPVIAYPAGSFSASTIALASETYKAGFAVFANASYRNRFAYPRVGLGNEVVSELPYVLGSLRLNWLLPLKQWSGTWAPRRLNACAWTALRRDAR
jgi:peptidoglycan/xylan/chitin deacetylase (PgdA/CDA1 family)